MIEQRKVDVRLGARDSSGWSFGSVNYNGMNYDVQVKWFDEPSRFGINGGVVSKLFVTDEDEKVIVSYDRGWDVKPKSVRANAILDAIVDKLESRKVMEHSKTRSITLAALRRYIVAESTGEQFKEIIKQAYPWLDKEVRTLIYNLYMSESWFPDDAEELKEDIFDIVNARCTPSRAKFILTALEEPEEDEDEFDDSEVELDDEFGDDEVEIDPGAPLGVAKSTDALGESTRSRRLRRFRR